MGILPYSLDHTPRLLLISQRDFVWLLFKSGDYLRAVFINFTNNCKGKGCEISQFHNSKYASQIQLTMAADAREEIRRETATLRDESDPSRT